MGINLEAQVKLGTEWLDSNRPGWYEKIDINLLQMNSCKSCIFGQLDGDYLYAMDLIKKKPLSNWATDRGFCPDTMTQAEQLTILWKDVIVNKKKGLDV